MLKRHAQITALLCVSVLLHACDSRTPESALFGTWRITMPFGMDTTDWLALKSDHTFVWFISDGMRERVDSHGTWFAGGSYLYTRVEGKQHIWQIMQILPDELRLRIAKQDYILKRDDQKSTPSI
jgi:hypothetical protein